MQHPFAGPVIPNTPYTLAFLPRGVVLFRAAYIIHVVIINVHVQGVEPMPQLPEDGCLGLDG
jgi:hypothetical protein